MRHLTRSEQLKGERGKTRVGTGLRGIGGSEGLRMNRMKQVRALISDEITHCQSHTVCDTKKYCRYWFRKSFTEAYRNSILLRPNVKSSRAILCHHSWVVDNGCSISEDSEGLLSDFLP